MSSSAPLVRTSRRITDEGPAHPRTELISTGGSGPPLIAAGSGGEGGAEEGAELVAEAAQADGVGPPADGAERLGLGGDAGDRGVAERGDEAGVAPAEPAGVHLGREVADGAVDERLQALTQPGRPGRTRAG